MPRRRKHKVGDWLVQDDESGIVHYRSEMVERWDGLYVRKNQYETRQPQEFVKAKTDPRAVQPIRPEGPVPAPNNTIPRFIGTTNILTPLGPASHLFDIRAALFPPGIVSLAALGSPRIDVWEPGYVDNQGSAYLLRAGVFDNITTSRVGMFALRTKLPDSGQAIDYLANEQGTVEVLHTAGDRFRVNMADGVGFASSDDITTNGTFSNAAGSMNILFTWDTDAVAGSRTYRMWVNEVEQALTVNQSGPAFDPEFDSTDNWALLTDPASPGTAIDDVCLSDFYVNNLESLDFSDVANRRLFFTAKGLPEVAGPRGEAPTGNIPLIFFNGDGNRFSDNRGTGGGFLRTGDFITCDDPLAAAGIASTNVFGAQVVAPGTAELAPEGIASVNAFGSPHVIGPLQPLDFDGAGIASTNTFGAPAIFKDEAIDDAIIGDTFLVR